MKNHLREFEDLAVNERGNGLEERGGQGTTRLMEEIVKKVKEKINRRPPSLVYTHEMGQGRWKICLEGVIGQ